MQGLLSLSNFTAFNEMGIAGADAAAAVGSGQPIKANATLNNGAKEIPWIKVLNFNVNKENIAKAADDYPWWFDKAKLKI